MPATVSDADPAGAQPARPAWRRADLLPAGLVGLLGLLLAAFLLAHAHGEDRAFEAHLRALAQGYLSAAEQSLARRVQDYAWWDEAVERVGSPTGLDAAWAERNLGAVTHAVIGADGAYVLYRGGAVLFGSHSGEPEVQDDGSVLARLARHAGRQPESPPRPVTGIVLLNGQLHLAAASPLTVFDTEQAQPENAPSTILVFTAPLADAFAPAARVERWFGHLVVGKPDRSALSIPLTDIDGQQLGSLTWTADRPSTAFLRVALPMLALGLFVMGAVIDRLWRRVQAHAAALEDRNAALSESERRFQTLVRAVPVGLFRTDGLGQCTYANDRCARFARIADEAGDGLMFLRSAHPEDRARVLIRWHDAILQGHSFRAEFRTTASDGDPCWVAVEAQPQRDERGAVEGFLGTITDITVLKRVQEDLAGREELLRLIADGVPALIGYVDRGHVYRFHNARIEDWLGVPLSRVIGRPMRDVLGEDLHARLKPHVDTVFTGQSVMVEEHVQIGGGPERILSIQGIPHRNARGEVVGLFFLATDVTEHHRIESALEEARDRAEGANHAKSRFLAAASHDLRQPLHALGLFLELLANAELTPPQRELLERARQSFHGTEELLSLLLDISRLEAGAVEPSIGPVDLPDLFGRLEAQVALEAEAKGLRLRFHPLPETVASDGVLLERILRNLLINAIRYTQRGGILLGCRRVGHFIRIEVWDTGTGIAPELLGRIFEEFYQIGNAERDARRGLGLGLAIVNRLALLLGHPVGVRSRVGRGSCFSISVPLLEEPAATGRESEEAPGDDVAGRLAGHRVAVIDDNPHALAAVRHFLEALGIEPVAAETGEALIEALAEGGAPDAIIADLRLRGGMVGTDVIAEVRRLYGDGVPGLLLTGDTAPERVRQAVDSGYVLLHKPVRPAALIEALAGVLSPAKAA